MPNLQAVTILLLEDDPGSARLIQKKLERAGYAVDIARDGAEGLALVAAGDYEVLLVDHHIPVHDGLEVIRILASRGPLPPTVMITGAGSERLAVKAMKLGARDYMVKDVEGVFLELLPAVLEQVLEGQRLIEEKRRAEEERERLIVELQQALAKVRTLRGLLPICASCKKIRDDQGYWQQVEVYVESHSEAEFTHGICPECKKRLYPQLYGDE